MRSGIFGLAMLGSVLVATAAQAQDVPQDDGITVTGQREVARSEAKRFVTQVATTVGGQFARFHDPVCPTVMGIPDEFANVVTARFRQVAADAGIRVAPANCAPNIVVIVAADADSLVKGMRKQIPGLFRGLDLADIRKAMREGPVHVWSTVQQRNEDSMMGSGTASTGAVALAPGGPPTAGASTLGIRKASILEESVQQVTVQSIMVVDDQAVLGKTLTQFADYAAMRTLAGARPPKETNADTILTLFDTNAVAPPTLSLVDRSYLKGLYETRGLSKGMNQAATIARTITEDSRERSGMRD